MIDDMMTWISSECLTWTLECDPHVAYCENIMDYLEFSMGDMSGIERFAEAEHLWIVQAYPTTISAFYVTCGTTMIEALMRMYNTLHNKEEDAYYNGPTPSLKRHPKLGAKQMFVRSFAG